VLVILGNASQERGITDLCKNTGFPLGTMSRIIATLGKMDFVVQNPTTKKYSIGPAVNRLVPARSELSTLRDASKPTLCKLRDRTGETSHLYIRRGPYREHVDFVESTHELRTSGNVGDRVPIHAGASSRVLWAFDSDEKIETLLRSIPLTTITKDTVVNREKLLQEAAKIRKQKYAVSYGERNPSIGAIAAPVFDQDRKVIAALSVSMPSVRFSPKHIQELIPEVMRAAAELSQALYGYLGCESKEDLPNVTARIRSRKS
jgi:DNA-binding IclR family transcriptional regulator